MGTRKRFGTRAVVFSALHGAVTIAAWQYYRFNHQEPLAIALLAVAVVANMALLLWRPPWFKEPAAAPDGVS